MFCIKDISLAERGEEMIEAASLDMPGLSYIVRSYAGKHPLAGARIAGCLHVTVETAVLIRALQSLGAQVRWSSCNIHSTNDYAAAALAKSGVSVFAIKGETEEQYWNFIEQTLQFPNGEAPNLLLDDGADLITHVHNKFPHLLGGILGASEETTTGIKRLRDMQRNGTLKTPIINVNDAVTKSKFDNRYGCRESLIDGIKRATDSMIAGKLCVVCGYGDVGKGCAQAFRGQGARVVVTEIDPICALQAIMDGYEVLTLQDVVSRADIIITATGNIDVVSADIIEQLKSGVILGNIGHFDCEIDMSYLAKFPKKSMGDSAAFYTISGQKRIVVLADGRLLNLGCATGHSPFVMSASFSNQIFAQLALFLQNDKYKEHIIYDLPKKDDETVARIHLEHLGGKITKLKKNQADYLGLQDDGPFKEANYRY